MAKLYFRHGAVSSAKTLNLLAVAHNYQVQGKSVILLKPELDTRFTKGNITSRAGLEKEANVLINQDTNLYTLELQEVSCILVDEAQFISPIHVEQLRELTVINNIPVICYGLRTDFRGRLFPASARLMELADSIEEIKTTCFYCNRKAVFNLKHVNGKANCSGPSIQLGCEETYYPTCYACYRGALIESNDYAWGK